jgi:hypothetical protein
VLRGTGGCQEDALITAILASQSDLADAPITRNDTRSYSPFELLTPAALSNASGAGTSMHDSEPSMEPLMPTVTQAS